MMAVATGEAVPDDYIAMMREDLTDDSLAVAQPEMAEAARPRHAAGAEVVIIGAGMSGLYAGIQLQQAGIPFVILEKNDAVGGTWYENIYPGCGVDTPEPFLFLRLRAQSRLVAFLRQARRALELFRARRRQIRSAKAYPARHRGGRRQL